MSKVYTYLIEHWSEKYKEAIKPYFTRRNELTMEQGCIMWGHRVIILTKFGQGLMQELRSRHLCTVKMKSMARPYFWYPKMDEDIENLAKSCQACLRVLDDAQKAIPGQREGLRVRSYKEQNYMDWVESEIVKKIGNNTYLCKTRDGKIWKRPKNQIREFNSEKRQ